MEKVGALKTDLSRYSTRDRISALRDAADNLPMIEARQRANSINRELNRALGSKTPDARNDVARQALAFAVEAKGSKAALALDRAKIAASTEAKPAVKQAALKAIDFAEDNWDKLRGVVAKHEAETKGQWRAENASGVDTPFREGYVLHAQDVLGDNIDVPFARGSDGVGGNFKKPRSYDTLADSIADGYRPKSTDAVSLLEERINRGQRLLERQAWAESGRHIADPSSGMPIIGEMETRTIKRPGQPDVVVEKVPQGYVSMQVGSRNVPVLRGYAGLYKSLTQDSMLDNTVLGRAVMKGVSAAKHTILGLDTYHPFRVFYWNVGLRGLSVLKDGLPGYKKGGWLLDQTMPEIEREIRGMKLPPEEEQGLIQQAREQKVKLDRGVRNGLNVGAMADNIHAELVHQIPGIGKYNKWLFDSFQRGAMAESYLFEHDRLAKNNPAWSSEKVAQEAVKGINTRFGNLRNQSWIKSKTGQDLMRLAFLAPQWNEGLIRSEIGGYRDLAKAPFTGSIGTLGRTMGNMMVFQFVANQIINMTTRGHPTWQNPEEGIDSKLAAWIPDPIGKSHGLFLDPFALPAETTGTLIRDWKKQGSIRGATADLVRNKLGPGGRLAQIAMTGKNSMGLTLRSPTDVAKAIGSVFLPIQTQPVVEAARSAMAGHIKEAAPGDTERQLFANAGVRTHLAPSYMQRIQQLANEYKREHNTNPPQEHDPSPYRPLFQALQRNDAEDAAAELETLKKGHTPEQIARFLHTYPNHHFAGPVADEVKFIGTLSPEQKQAYVKAMQERLDMAEKAKRFILTGKVTP